MGPFSGPENGPHVGAAAQTRSRTAAVIRTLEIRRPFAAEMQYATCLGISTASHHVRIRPTAASRAHMLCCRLLPLTPSSCQRQREKDTEHTRERRERERGREAAARTGSSERARQTSRNRHGEACIHRRYAAAPAAGTTSPKQTPSGRLRHQRRLGHLPPQATLPSARPRRKCGFSQPDVGASPRRHQGPQQPATSSAAKANVAEHARTS